MKDPKNSHKADRFSKCTIFAIRYHHSTFVLSPHIIPADCFHMLHVHHGYWWFYTFRKHCFVTVYWACRLFYHSTSWREIVCQLPLRLSPNIVVIWYSISLGYGNRLFCDLTSSSWLCIILTPKIRIKHRFVTLHLGLHITVLVTLWFNIFT